jgi:hypothetical protein
MRVQHCTYGHSVVTLLNPLGLSFSRVESVARHASVVVAVPSTVHHPANYKIQVRYSSFLINKSQCVCLCVCLYVRD